MRNTLFSGRRALALLAPAALLLPSAEAQQEIQPLLGSPVRGLTPAQLDLFYLGLDSFNLALTEQDGLGPIFNEPACGSCHNHPAAGGSSVRMVTRFSIGMPFDPLEALGGPLLQDQALDPVNCGEVIPPEADHIINRVTPHCFGAGLLETVVDADIIANETNGGVHSDVGDLSDPNAPLAPARFGWKGAFHNVISFSIGASLNEMGLTSVFLPNENAPNGDQQKLAACDTVADYEDLPDGFGKTRVDRFTDFQRYLAAPPQTPRSGMTGELLFNQVGCVTCHVSTYVTGAAPESALTGQTIQPYGDFLLHHMGALADGFQEDNAAETQMMTRALWGLGARLSFLHDGRITGLGTFFDDMDAIIQEHDGDAAASRTAYNALNPVEQQQVADFLQSLGRVEFDQERDNDLDEFDWFFIEPYLTGPGTFYTPDDVEAFCDADQDGDFDLHEVGLLQIAFTGENPDVPNTLPVLEPVTALNLELRAGGAKKVTVAPGGQVHYEIRGELADYGPQGLAMFSFDLSFTGGPLDPLEEPDVLTTFTGPLGMANPAGFGGTANGRDLQQVGGAQNSIKTNFSTNYFTGDLVLGVADRGNRMVLARGVLTAPLATGTFSIDISNVRATAVLEDASANDLFWRVGPVASGVIDSLTVTVQDNAPQVYCTGKLSSDGCVPQLAWRGLPTLTSGGDNFALRIERAVPNEFAMVVWGLQPDSQPFNGGTLCVGGGLQRTLVNKTVGDGPCTGLYKFFFSQGYMAQFGLVVGTNIYAQGTFRDPDHVDGFNMGLTDAVTFQILP